VPATIPLTITNDSGG
nr:RecName: Full=Glucan endo-1,3-beta-glucosidase 1; AltName: Full=(1->3)-beta-glucan endohydrolase 1; Short=(1->3)-beta-glucanase 1 [Papiliotrema laurentii]